MTRLTGKSVWVMAKGFAPDEGGHQCYAEQVSLAYARAGARVTVVTQTSMGPRDTNYGPLRLVDLGPGKGIGVPFRWFGALRMLRRQDGIPDFCHATTWRTAVPPMVLGMLFACTFHGREFMYVRSAGFAMLKAVARRSSLLIAVSAYTATRLQERLAATGRIATAALIAWNGCNLAPLPRTQRKSGDPVRIMTLCRLEPRKGVLTAVAALEQLAKEGNPFEYVICGRGPEQANIAAAITLRGLDRQIRMAGFVSNEEARKMYANSDIFLHPNVALDAGRDFEGFGIAIADAMRAGCAVVVGRDGGSAELVEHGRSGMVVDGNDPAAIAAVLRQLLSDSSRLANIAAAGRIRSALFDWDRHVAAILDQTALTQSFATRHAR